MERPLRAQIGLANLFGPSPGLKCEAPDLAATGSSAIIADLAGGLDPHSTPRFPRQTSRPILSLRYGAREAAHG